MELTSTNLKLTVIQIYIFSKLHTFNNLYVYLFNFSLNRNVVISINISVKSPTTLTFLRFRQPVYATIINKEFFVVIFHLKKNPQIIQIWI